MLRAEARLAWVVVSDPSATVCHFFAVPQPPDAYGSTDGDAGAGAGPQPDDHDPPLQAELMHECALCFCVV